MMGRTSAGSKTRAFTYPLLVESILAAASALETLVITIYPSFSSPEIKAAPSGWSPPSTT